jgi:hypothetical protein
MAFKMKGGPFKRNFNIGAKSPLEQKADFERVDPEYKDEILALTGGSEDISDVNLAEKKIQRKAMNKRVKDLKWGKGLNRTLRKEKKLQNERLRSSGTLQEDRLGTWDEDKGFVGGGRDKDRKTFRKYTLNEDGSKNWGMEIKRPKWWSSAARKKDYIKTMQGRQIQPVVHAQAAKLKPSANEGVPFGYNQD